MNQRKVTSKSARLQIHPSYRLHSKLAGLNLNLTPLPTSKKTPTRPKLLTQGVLLQGQEDPIHANLQRKHQEDAQRREEMQRLRREKLEEEERRQTAMFDTERVEKRKRYEEALRLAEERRISASIKTYNLAKAWYLDCDNQTVQLHVEVFAAIIDALESPRYFVMRRNWLAKVETATGKEGGLDCQRLTITAEVDKMSAEIGRLRSEERDRRQRVRDLEKRRLKELSRAEHDHFWVGIRLDRNDEHELSAELRSDEADNEDIDLVDDDETDELSGDAAFDQFKDTLVRLVGMPKTILWHMASTIHQASKQMPNQADNPEVKKLREAMSKIWQAQGRLALSAHRLRDSVRQRRIPNRVVDEHDPLQRIKESAIVIRVDDMQIMNAVASFKAIITTMPPRDDVLPAEKHAELSQRLTAFERTTRSGSRSRRSLTANLMGVSENCSLLGKVELSRALCSSPEKANLAYWRHIRTRYLIEAALIVRNIDALSPMFKAHSAIFRSDMTGISRIFLQAQPALDRIIKGTCSEGNPLPDVTARLQGCLDKMRKLSWESDRRWLGDDILDFERDNSPTAQSLKIPQEVCSEMRTDDSSNSACWTLGTLQVSPSALSANEVSAVHNSTGIASANGQSPGPTFKSSTRVMFTPTRPHLHQLVDPSNRAMDSQEFIPIEDIEAADPNTRNGDDQSASSDYSDSEAASNTEAEEYVPLAYQVPAQLLADTLEAYGEGKDVFWSHDMFRGPNNEIVLVQYCKSKEVCERVAQQFLGKKVLGFDIEWRPNARRGHGIKQNVSIVQIAAEERIALFHLALHKGNTAEEIVPPTLRTIMESPDILKTGVSIRADCTRMKEYLNIETRGMIELSHLHNLVTHPRDGPTTIKKTLVSLTKQMLEHFGLPLRKDKVRTSDWATLLSNDQARYAATDAYAGFRLFDVLEQKRLAMNPVPHRPAPVEDNMPIVFKKQIDSGDRTETAEDVLRDAAGFDFSSDLDSDTDAEAPDHGCRLQDLVDQIESSATTIHVLEAQAWAAVWQDTSAHRSSSQARVYADRKFEIGLTLYYLWHYFRFAAGQASEMLSNQGMIANDEDMTDTHSKDCKILEVINSAGLDFDRPRLLDLWAPLGSNEKSRYPNIAARLND